MADEEGVFGLRFNGSPHFPSASEEFRAERQKKEAGRQIIIEDSESSRKRWDVAKEGGRV